MTLRRTAFRTLLIVALAASAAGCASVTAPTASSMVDRVVETPFLRILGTAQDAGLPHAACTCDRCDAARRDPARARSVASMALVLPGTPAPQVILVDASPDIRRQLDALEDVRDEPADRSDRNPVDGILLTHAHIGHYLGLAFFGFESVNSRGIPTWCTSRMASFLRTNGPWSQLVELGNIELREIEPDAPFTLGDVEIRGHLVPHRDEFSDTVAYVFRGPARTVLYVPDTEPWRTWSPGLDAYLDSLPGGVDVLVVDATFFDPNELPGRAVASIGHPLMTDTMDLLQSRVDAGTLEVFFTHLNHSNPALDPHSDARRLVESRGFRVAEDGMEIPLR